MAISIQDVMHIAKLAKLTFSEAELEQFTRELNQIIEYVEKLNELDTSNVEPLSHTTAIHNVMRADQVTTSLPVEKVLENAPSREGNFFKVPKVVK